MNRIAPLVALALVGTADDARAQCTCDPVPARTAPADGATDVPIDVQILVYQGPTAGYVLTGPGGEVSWTLQQVSEEPALPMQVLRPTVLLEPGATYLLEAGDDFAPVSFTTGLEEDLVPPLDPTVGELSMAMAGSISAGCLGWFHDVRLPIELLGDAVAAELEITDSADTETRQILLFPEELADLSHWYGGCDPTIDLSRDETYTVEVRARDLGGNPSPGVTRTVTVRDDCPTIPSTACTEVSEVGLEDCDDGYDGCPLDDSGVQDDPEPVDDGGCSASPHASLALALVLPALLLRRRRRRS